MIKKSETKPNEEIERIHKFEHAVQNNKYDDDAQN
jgi:hypothetical protein